MNISHIKSPAARRFSGRPPEEREKLIATLHKGIQREVMYKHFVEGKTFRVIAGEMHYVERTVYRNYKCALATIEHAVSEDNAADA
jgi:hypothetical protein